MSESWAPDLARRIAAEIRRLRGDRSGQWLSDRTDELGHRVSRTTISELENGKRQTVGVDALIVLAAALEVTPADLIYPSGGEVELLPGKFVPRSAALEALGGGRQLVDPDRLLAAAEGAAERVREGMQDIRELADVIDERLQLAQRAKTVAAERVFYVTEEGEVRDITAVQDIPGEVPASRSKSRRNGR